MIEHSSTPENLHSLLIDDAGEWAYRCHLEISLGNESYVRLKIVDRRTVGDGLKMPSGKIDAGSEPYARFC